MLCYVMLCYNNHQVCYIMLDTLCYIMLQCYVYIL